MNITDYNHLKKIIEINIHNFTTRPVRNRKQRYICWILGTKGEGIEYQLQYDKKNPDYFCLSKMIWNDEKNRWEGHQKAVDESGLFEVCMKIDILDKMRKYQPERWEEHFERQGWTTEQIEQLIEKHDAIWKNREKAR